MTPAELYDADEQTGDEDARTCDYCGADLDGYGHPRGADLLCAECMESTLLCEGCCMTVDNNDARHSPDGHSYCEDCADDRGFTCERCGETFWRTECEPTEIHGNDYCDDCAADVEADDNECPDCMGTGIGYGPPDVSRCGACHGSGVVRRPFRDPADYWEMMRDLREDR